MQSDGQEWLEIQFRQCPLCILQPGHQLIFLCRLPPAALSLQSCCRRGSSCMGGSAGTTLQATGVADIGDLSIEVCMGSAEDLLVSLFLFCSWVVVILDEAVLPTGFEEPLELDDDGGRFRLADFSLESAGLLLIEQGSFGCEALIDNHFVERLLQVLPAECALCLAQGLIIETFPWETAIGLIKIVSSGVDFNAIASDACPACILGVLPTGLLRCSHGADAQSFELAQRKWSFLGLLLCLCLSPQRRVFFPSGAFTKEEVPGRRHDATGQGYCFSSEGKRGVRFASGSGGQHC